MGCAASDRRRAALYRRGGNGRSVPGESLTETATDQIQQVPMPQAITKVLAAFITEHHVEQPFVKRKRDRADPQALARRAPLQEDSESAIRTFPVGLVAQKTARQARRKARG